MPIDDPDVDSLLPPPPNKNAGATPLQVTFKNFCSILPSPYQTKIYHPSLTIDHCIMRIPNQYIIQSSKNEICYCFEGELKISV